MFSSKQIDYKHNIILDSIADGVFTVDLEWKITSFNCAAEKITGIPREEALGRFCHDVFRASICETDCALKRTMKTKKPIVNKPVYITSATGSRMPISISTAVFKDESGKIIGGVETFRDLSMVEQLRKELTKQHSLGDIISKNHEMQEIFTILPEIATSESTVLIEGPSGSGKELFAKAIHNLSQRRKKAFVAVNCAAMPDTLLESELFGYVAGAFTDAKKNKPGRFALAQGGTIFLDEISDVSPALQVKLLRVLQEKEFEPLGSTRATKADVRVLVSTNKRLEILVKEGKFREDLYYRINIIKIILPSLSQRKEDIPLLIDHIIGRFNRLRGKDITGVSEDTMNILMHHDYPGNVRELENIIEHAFILCKSGLIRPEHLPNYLGSNGAERWPVRTTLAAMERRFIYESLISNNWNRLATARELGINKTTLWRKIRRLDIKIPDTGGESSMERFRNYVGRTVSLERIKQAVASGKYGLTGRYLPDPPEDFDEFEFVTDWNKEKQLALMVTVEQMKIKRIFWGVSSPEDPDIVKALSDEELKRFLEKRGDIFIRFFDYITQD